MSYILFTLALYTWLESKSIKESLLDNEKYQGRVTFNVTFYPVLESIRIILEELDILIAPYEQHEKVFTYNTIIGFKNVKGQKHHDVRSNLSKIPRYIDVAGSSGSCGAKGLACQL